MTGGRPAHSSARQEQPRVTGHFPRPLKGKRFLLSLKNGLTSPLKSTRTLLSIWMLSLTGIWIVLKSRCAMPKFLSLGIYQRRIWPS